jgi:hypothetical protein
MGVGQGMTIGGISATVGLENLAMLLMSMTAAEVLPRGNSWQAKHRFYEIRARFAVPKISMRPGLGRYSVG